jgi:two-component system, response regulator
MNQKTILLVEDNPDDAALTIRAFKKNNINNKIVTVTDGEQALNYLFGAHEFAGRNTSEMPAVILLDLKLPKLDGLQVLKEIKSHPLTKTIPAVVLTSSLEKHDLVKSYHSGANSYIQKPIDFDNFFETVKQLGKYWLMLNELPPAN